MDRIKQIAYFLFICAALFLPANAAAPAPQTKVKLLLSHEAARPGETITAALEITSNPNWHTYWRNPGDSGLPTTIEWDFPPGITAGAIQWPVPHKMELMKFSSYVYEGTEYLLVPITIAPDAKPGAITLKGKVDWLECAETCNPQSADISHALTIGNESKPSAAAAVIEKARGRLPKTNAPFSVSARWEPNADAKKRTLVVEWPAPATLKNPDFYPYELEGYTFDESVAKGAIENGVVRIRKVLNLEDATLPPTVRGLVLNDTTAKEPSAYEVTLSPSSSGAVSSGGTVQGRSSGSGSPAGQPSIFLALGLAFLGGLILNIMPCVLPVIALKILSFVNQSGTEPKRARQLGLVYALGVMASFAVLAGIIIAVQQAGGIASWGMQYQNPIFLVALITLVTLIALNLFGVFEITLGGKAMGSASELASREGTSGAFFNGVLATVLGTSCTAPFLALAIGYAISQPAYVTLLIFLMMGVGLAFPYVILTWNPALLRLLPKPGAWMERFKVAMGFPMLATAVWLYSVAVGAHFGSNGAFWLAMFLVLVALAAWIFGTFIQRGVKRRGLAIVIAVGAMAFAVGFVLEKQLNWRNPDYTKIGAAMASSAKGVQWQKWSPDAVAKARAEGKPILVDFTASWCPNCQVNKHTSIEIEPVIKKLEEIDGIAMIADFTRKDPVIAEELKKFERYAVPMVLVYSSDANEPPRVLPPTLTPGIVLEALEWAGRNPAQSRTTSTEKLAQTAK